MKKRKKKQLAAVTPPDMDACVRAVELPPKEWAGKCYGVACAINRKLNLGWKEVFGFYVGKFAPNGIFASRSNLGFTQHGWLCMPDERIFDPTRWVFEDDEPYLYCDYNKGEYDQFGDKVDSMFRDARSPVFKDDEKVYNFGMRDGKAAAFVRTMIPSYPTLCTGQMFWLANRPLSELGKHAHAIYSKFERIKMQALIPLDRRREILGR